MDRAVLDTDTDTIRLQPRLLGVDGAAAYLSISPWTVRALVANGHLTPIKLPACHRSGENGRRLLFAREDLDLFVESRRGA